MKYAKRYSISVIVLLVSLLITWVAWQYTRDTIRVKEESLFLRETQEIEDLIRYRLDDYIEALFGLQSLFATDEIITRQRWQAYCDNLNLQSRIPGIHSLSFNTYIPASEKAAFIEHVKSDTTLSPQGFPEFTIFSAPNLNIPPNPHQAVYYVVTYIWPWEENIETHGLELFSNPVHRLAIEQARDTGKPFASSRITLMIERDQSVPGFAIYLPVYRFGLPLSTIEERRMAIQGLLAAMFRTYELLENALGRMRRHPGIGVEIFDGNVLTAEYVYYNDDDILQAQNTSYTSLYSKNVPLNVYGQPWTLFFSSKPNFGLETTEASLPILVLSIGVVFSVLVAGTIFSLTTSQLRAVRMAERITQQLEQQRALSMRSDRLRSLGEMAAGIAHELSQPLVGVRGLAEHILIGQDRGWNLSAQTIRDKVATIVEQADRMAHIIEHIRIFAREAGKPELRPVNVNDVVESSMNLLGAQFSSHGLALEKTLSADLPAVLANPFSLEEVVLNLLINARDAVEERLQAEPDMRSPGVLLRTQAIRANERLLVTIEVADNGGGIPLELQGKMFDPFFTTKSPDKGTGLGLAISKTIVEEFGGTLTIRSTPAEQTTAIVTLPAASPST